ncbi:TetR/AcrR family transcriptional regulator [Paenibacillus hexagrammi]|uniref:WHG domain-containing protein n=1 Tax=Paenibacillus hexagrammi TaxID=2908839 RepID=A0ABY3SHR2_9BACL|nr:TetR/AcrR family transcriptional regulator [Paenibacillus sp. YPD9-1]UJF33491.1 WHG domain-containing protein [Paenibacillus sp. YPD9-1]
MANRPGLDTDTVLRAAIDIANNGGIEQVSLAALAAKLNVKTPSLYNHINGLPALRKQLSLLGMIRIREQMVDAVLGKSGSGALLAAGLAYVQFARDNPGLYDAFSSTQDFTDPELQEASSQTVGLILRILEEFAYAEEEALHIVRGFRSLVHGFASIELKNGFQIGLNRDTSLHMLLTTYLRGLEAERKVRREEQ